MVPTTKKDTMNKEKRPRHREAKKPDRGGAVLRSPSCAAPPPAAASIPNADAALYGGRRHSTQRRRRSSLAEEEDKEEEEDEEGEEDAVVGGDVARRKCLETPSSSSVTAAYGTTAAIFASSSLSSFSVPTPHTEESEWTTHTTGDALRTVREKKKERSGGKRNATRTAEAADAASTTPRDDVTEDSAKARLEKSPAPRRVEQEVGGGTHLSGAVRSVSRTMQETPSAPLTTVPTVPQSSQEAAEQPASAWERVSTVNQSPALLSLSSMVTPVAMLLRHFFGDPFVFLQETTRPRERRRLHMSSGDHCNQPLSEKVVSQQREQQGVGPEVASTCRRDHSSSSPPSENSIPDIIICPPSSSNSSAQSNSFQVSVKTPYSDGVDRTLVISATPTTTTDESQETPSNGVAVGTSTIGGVTVSTNTTGNADLMNRTAAMGPMDASPTQSAPTSTVTFVSRGTSLTAMGATGVTTVTNTTTAGTTATMEVQTELHSETGSLEELPTDVLASESTGDLPLVEEMASGEEGSSFAVSPGGMTAAEDEADVASTHRSAPVASRSSGVAGLSDASAVANSTRTYSPCGTEAVARDPLGHSEGTSGVHMASGTTGCSLDDGSTWTSGGAATGASLATLPSAALPTTTTQIKTTTGAAAAGGATHGDATTTAAAATKAASQRSGLVRTITSFYDDISERLRFGGTPPAALSTVAEPPGDSEPPASKEAYSLKSSDVPSRATSAESGSTQGSHVIATSGRSISARTSNDERPVSTSSSMLEPSWSVGALPPGERVRCYRCGVPAPESVEEDPKLRLVEGLSRVRSFSPFDLGVGVGVGPSHPSDVTFAAAAAAAAISPYLRTRHIGELLSIAEEDTSRSSEENSDVRGSSTSISSQSSQSPARTFELDGSFSGLSTELCGCPESDDSSNWTSETDSAISEEMLVEERGRTQVTSRQRKRATAEERSGMLVDLLRQSGATSGSAAEQHLVTESPAFRHFLYSMLPLELKDARVGGSGNREAKDM